jgi:hypothetical protein
MEILYDHFFSNTALEYAISKVQEKQVGQKLSETCQLLAYAEDVNLLGDSIVTTKKHNIYMMPVRRLALN